MSSAEERARALTAVREGRLCVLGTTEERIALLDPITAIDRCADALERIAVALEAKSHPRLVFGGAELDRVVREYFDLTAPVDHE